MHTMEVLLAFALLACNAGTVRELWDAARRAGAAGLPLLLRVCCGGGSSRVPAAAVMHGATPLPHAKARPTDAPPHAVVGGPRRLVMAHAPTWGGDTTDEED